MRRTPAPGRRATATAATAAAAGLVLVGAVAAGCSGDDDSDGGGPDGSDASRSGAAGNDADVTDAPGTTPDPDATPPEGDADATADLPGSASTGESAPALEGEDCEVEIVITGSVDASWTGGGDTVTGDETGAPAVYEAQDGSLRLTLSAGSGDFDPSVLLTDFADGGVTYGSTPGEGDLDIAADGSGASVAGELVAPELPGETVNVTATFVC